MVNQYTLKSHFCLKGKGLRSGLGVRVTFNPAPENYGYKLRRTDVTGQPVIDALAENVTDTKRRTILSANGISVGAVEHALAALYACRVDNCLIDIDGPELPALDGSAILFVRGIKEAGLRRQNAMREYISFSRKRINVEDKASGSSMLLIPDSSFSICCRISYDSLLLNRQDAILNDLSEFARDFAPARTFVFVKEIGALLSGNLIKGGNLDNAVAIYYTPLDQVEFDRLADMTGTKRKDAGKLGYILNKPQLYPDEPARHKLLDIIGSLALV